MSKIHCLKLNEGSLLKTTIPLPREKNVEENKKGLLVTLTESLHGTVECLLYMPHNNPELGVTMLVFQMRKPSLREVK